MDESVVKSHLHKFKCDNRDKLMMNLEANSYLLVYTPSWNINKKCLNQN